MSIEIDSSNNKVIAGGNDIASIGVGQTWQDMTSERASGTDYINDTGRPIMISLYTTQNNSTDRKLEIFVDSLLVYRGHMGTSTTTGAEGFGATSIIPAGSTYCVTFGELQSWFELR